MDSNLAHSIIKQAHLVIGVFINRTTKKFSGILFNLLRMKVFRNLCRKQQN